MITVVLFDADDTLWDYSSSMRLALHATLEELWSRIPGRATSSMTVDRVVEIRDRVAGELDGRVLDLSAIRLAAFERALEESGIPDGDLAAELAASYYSHLAHVVSLFDDTLPALDSLASRRLAIVSNGAADAERLGIGDRFEVIVRSNDVGAGKPDPTIIHVALDRLGVHADEAVMVGDSEVADIAAARAAGVRSVLVNRAEEPVETQADWTVKSLLELKRVLDAVQ